MLICVSVYHNTQLSCDVTASECRFKKDRINWGNINWPFPPVHPAHLCRKRWMNVFVLFVPVDHTLTPWHTLTPFDLFQPSPSELEGVWTSFQWPCRSLSLSLFVCLAYETVSDREVMWAVAFIWMLSQRKRPLSGTVQRLTVTQFVHLSFKTRAERA